jgi:hypothetical protein
MTPLEIASQQSARLSFYMRGGPITRFEFILFSVGAGAVMLVGLCWQLLDNWKKRTLGKNWPTASAIIDVVSVAFIEDDTPGMKPIQTFPAIGPRSRMPTTIPSSRWAITVVILPTRMTPKRGRIPTNAKSLRST